MGNVLDSIDGYIAVSRALWDIHLAHLPELREKPSEVVYNPVTTPLKYVNVDYEEPYNSYIFYASGSNPVKGPHMILKAWEEIWRDLKDYKLYMIACKGTWVEEEAKKRGLRNIIFTEKLVGREYYDLMYRARLVVMPSILPEAFGRIPVEANRLGVPAVVSNAGGLPETIVDRETGYIYDSRDTSELIGSLLRALNNSAFHRKRIHEVSLAKINPAEIIERLLSFFESIKLRG